MDYSDEEVREKSAKPLMLLLLVIGVAAIGGYYFFTSLHSENVKSTTLATIAASATVFPDSASNLSYEHSVSVDENRKDLFSIANNGGADATVNLLIFAPKSAAESASDVSITGGVETRVINEDPVFNVIVRVKAGDTKDVLVTTPTQSLDVGLIFIPITTTAGENQVREIQKMLVDELSKQISELTSEQATTLGSELSSVVSGNTDLTQMRIEVEAVLVKYSPAAAVTSASYTPQEIVLHASALLPYAELNLNFEKSTSKILVKMEGTLGQYVDIKQEGANTKFAFDLSKLEIRGGSLYEKTRILPLTSLYGTIKIGEANNLNSLYEIPVSIEIRQLNTEEFILLSPNPMSFKSWNGVNALPYLFVTNNLPFKLPAIEGCGSSLDNLNGNSVGVMPASPLQDKTCELRQNGLSLQTLDLNRKEADSSGTDALKFSRVSTQLLASEFKGTIDGWQTCSSHYCFCSQFKDSLNAFNEVFKSHVNLVLPEKELYQKHFGSTYEEKVILGAADDFKNCGIDKTLSSQLKPYAFNLLTYSYDFDSGVFSVKTQAASSNSIFDLGASSNKLFDSYAVLKADPKGKTIAVNDETLFKKVLNDGAVQEKKVSVASPVSKATIDSVIVNFDDCPIQIKPNNPQTPIHFEISTAIPSLSGQPIAKIYAIGFNALQSTKDASNLNGIFLGQTLLAKKTSGKYAGTVDYAGTIENKLNGKTYLQGKYKIYVQLWDSKTGKIAQRFWYSSKVSDKDFGVVNVVDQPALLSKSCAELTPPPAAVPNTATKGTTDSLEELKATAREKYARFEYLPDPASGDEFVKSEAELAKALQKKVPGPIFIPDKEVNDYITKLDDAIKWNIFLATLSKDKDFYEQMSKQAEDANNQQSFFNKPLFDASYLKAQKKKAGEFAYSAKRILSCLQSDRASRVGIGSFDDFITKGNECSSPLYYSNTQSIQPYLDSSPAIKTLYGYYGVHTHDVVRTTDPALALCIASLDSARELKAKADDDNQFFAPHERQFTYDLAAQAYALAQSNCQGKRTSAETDIAGGINNLPRSQFMQGVLKVAGGLTTPLNVGIIAVTFVYPPAIEGLAGSLGASAGVQTFSVLAARTAVTGYFTYGVAKSVYIQGSKLATTPDKAAFLSSAEGGELVSNLVFGVFLAKGLHGDVAELTKPASVATIRGIISNIDAKVSAGAKGRAGLNEIEAEFERDPTAFINSVDAAITEQYANELFGKDPIIKVLKPVEGSVGDEALSYLTPDAESPAPAVKTAPVKTPGFPEKTPDRIAYETKQTAVKLSTLVVEQNERSVEALSAQVSDASGDPVAVEAARNNLAELKGEGVPAAALVEIATGIESASKEAPAPSKETVDGLKTEEARVVSKSFEALRAANGKLLVDADAAIENPYSTDLNTEKAKLEAKIKELEAEKTSLTPENQNYVKDYQDEIDKLDKKLSEIEDKLVKAKELFELNLKSGIITEWDRIEGERPSIGRSVTERIKELKSAGKPNVEAIRTAFKESRDAYIEELKTRGIATPDSAAGMGELVTALFNEISQVYLGKYPSRIADAAVLQRKILGAALLQEHISLRERFSDHTFTHLTEDTYKMLGIKGIDKVFTPKEIINFRIIALLHDIGYTHESILKNQGDATIAKEHPGSSAGAVHEQLYDNLKSVVGDYSANAVAEIRSELEGTIEKANVQTIIDGIRQHSGKQKIYYTKETFLGDGKVISFFALTDDLAAEKITKLYLLPGMQQPLLDMYLEGNRLKSTDQELIKIREKYRGQMRDALSELKDRYTPEVYNQFLGAIDETTEFELNNLAPGVIDITSIGLTDEGLPTVEIGVSKRMYDLFLRKVGRDATLKQISKILVDLAQRSKAKDTRVSINGEFLTDDNGNFLLGFDDVDKPYLEKRLSSLVETASTKPGGEEIILNGWLKVKILFTNNNRFEGVMTFQ